MRQFSNKEQRAAFNVPSYYKIDKIISKKLYNIYTITVACFSIQEFGHMRVVGGVFCLQRMRPLVPVLQSFVAVLIAQWQSIKCTDTHRVFLLLLMLPSTSKAARRTAETGVGRYGGDAATNTLLTSKFSCLLSACLIFQKKKIN